jgi:simple sugar transport system ATP-binding protein
MPAAAHDKPYAVELRGLTKRFGSLVANSGVSLRAARGTVHAIVGENGAGKSTAMKMLYGLYAPDEGEILVGGKPWGGRGKWRSPRDAIACGIGMVHQHFMLAGPYTALENVVLGAESSRPGWRWLPRSLRPIDLASARRRLEAMSHQYGLEVDWDAAIEDLPVGVQQRIEILKLLYRDASVLVLDEPTAVLTPQETHALFANLRKLRAEGKTILIITHKLKEVMALADDVTVLRGGRVTGQVRAAETTPAQLADMMVGRKVILGIEAPPPPELGKPALELAGVSLAREEGSRQRLLSDVSLTVRRGEIVGIAGIEGNGQSELLRAIQQPRRYAGRLSGRVTVLGRETLSAPAEGGAQAARRGQGSRIARPGEVRALGVGIVPEDRYREAMLMSRSLRDNFLLGLQRRAPFAGTGARAGQIDYARLDQAVARALDEYDVRPRDPRAIGGRLSGGNQQKLVIARELERRPELLIAAQPTRGVDVGAIELIHRLIFRARDEGAGVLLVSSELDEILTLSDRILVMYAGRIVAEFARGQATEQALGLAMGGGAHD